MNTLSHLFPEQIERLKERFWKKVEIRGEDDCWEWTAALNTSGYGHIQVSTKRLSVAHRVCYMLRFGDIPPKMLVCHSCDNPKCVNPKHLWIGTHNQNMEDMASKIRSSNPSSRKVWTNPEIINQTVLEIVDKYKKGMSQAELALEFSLSKNTISRIVLGRSRGAITGQKKVLPKKNLRGINNSKAKLTEAELTLPALKRRGF